MEIGQVIKGYEIRERIGGGGFGNVYRAYGNRTPPFYSTINPRTPPVPDPTSAGAGTPVLRLDLIYVRGFRVRENQRIMRHQESADYLSHGLRPPQSRVPLLECGQWISSVTDTRPYPHCPAAASSSPWSASC